jgi:UDP-N-acetylglucosamine 2-epimerase (non-hydrolysing)
MNKYKILTLVGTRPEIIRISEIIKKFNKYFDNILVHTNQNFDKNLKDVFFKNFELSKPQYDFQIKENSAIKTIAKILIKTEEVIIKEKPHGFFVLGDTNSCLGALVAKRYKIPIFHYEAGNRCFDQRVPEEINRKIIDHISDLNLTYSDFASKNLLREGIPTDRVIKVGSPLYEVFKSNENKIIKSKILSKLNLKKDKYFLISFHREENVDKSERLKKFLSILNLISVKYNLKIILTTHPRTKAQIIKIKKTDFLNSKNIKMFEPFDYFDYMKLQKEALIVISDSGSISEESSFMGFRAITLRDTMERQESMENSCIIMSALNEINLINAIETQINSSFISKPINDYMIDDVSEKIPRLIISYIE